MLLRTCASLLHNDLDQIHQADSRANKVASHKVCCTNCSAPTLVSLCSPCWPSVTATWAGTHNDKSCACATCLCWQQQVGCTADKSVSLLAAVILVLWDTNQKSRTENIFCPAATSRQKPDVRGHKQAQRCTEGRQADKPTKNKADVVAKQRQAESQAGRQGRHNWT